MKRYVEGEDRSQATLFPERLEDYIAEDSPVRVIDVFVDELELFELGFEGMEPEATGRPSRGNAFTHTPHHGVDMEVTRSADRQSHQRKSRMVAISMSGSGEGPGGVTGPGYSPI